MIFIMVNEFIGGAMSSDDVAKNGGLKTSKSSLVSLL